MPALERQLLAVKSFDVERVRRNWDRAASAPRAPLPARFAEVPTPIDPYPEAQRILARIHALSRSEFPAQQRQLMPFLAEASDLLGRLRAGASNVELAAKGPEALATGASAVDAAPVASAEVRAQLLKVLDDLQDLFEVYSGIGLK